jgi:antitoxin (DNA-binding transcriptional repressor) of toxin-antitoxin stability system
MIKLNIHEAKTHLSKYLPRLAQGEKILLCRRNVPIAEIVPIRRSEDNPRPIGLAKGEFSLTPDFFEPLPEEIQGAFEGRGK